MKSKNVEESSGKEEESQSAQGGKFCTWERKKVVEGEEREKKRRKETKIEVKTWKKENGNGRKEGN